MRRKTERVIGTRALQWVNAWAAKNDMSLNQAIQRIGFKTNSVYYWGKQYVPSVSALQCMAEHGANINYILTGHSLHESKSEVGGR